MGLDLQEQLITKNREVPILGIDLSNDYVLVSYLLPDMVEPQSITTIAGEEKFLIPLVLYREAREGIWLYGQRAIQASSQEKGILYENILEQAFQTDLDSNIDTENSALKLLAIFFEKIFHMPKLQEMNLSEARIVLTIEDLNMKKSQILRQVMRQVGINTKRLVFIDYMDAFYAFTFHQSEDRYLHDVVLYQYQNKGLKQAYLTQERRTKPCMIKIKQDLFPSLEECKSDQEKDEVFAKILHKTLDGHKVSTIYLIGEGFENGFLNQSLQILCQNRKVFLGKNLYSCGACYYEACKYEKWDYIYMGLTSMKMNLAIQAKMRGDEDLVTLINAGDNCFSSYCACDLLLGEDPFIEILQRNPDGSGSKITSLELIDLPKRPPRASKVHMELKPLSDTCVQVTVEDLGLGELFPSSGKRWNYQLIAEE